MKYTLTLLTLLLIISCGTKKNQIENEIITADIENSINTKLKVSVRIPYCGGAQPTEDMLNRIEAVSDTFMIIGEDNFTQQVKSNELGIIDLRLPVGKYHLRELDKMASFETYLAKVQAQKRNAIQIGSIECYERYWKKNVIDFEITDSNALISKEGYLFSNCYTLNPCEIYTGPIRP